MDKISARVAAWYLALHRAIEHYSQLREIKRRREAAIEQLRQRWLEDLKRRFN